MFRHKKFWLVNIKNYRFLQKKNCIIRPLANFHIFIENVRFRTYNTALKLQYYFLCDQLSTLFTLFSI